MPDKKPNILFILTDQQRRDSMRAYGNTWIETPNLDRLAEKSFVFENTYVTQPVCTAGPCVDHDRPLPARNGPAAQQHSAQP